MDNSSKNYHCNIDTLSVLQNGDDNFTSPIDVKNIYISTTVIIINLKVSVIIIHLKTNYFTLSVSPFTCVQFSENLDLKSAFQGCVIEIFFSPNLLIMQIQILYSVGDERQALTKQGTGKQHCVQLLTTS